MKVGFVCGAFDLLHAGHINLLKQCSENCDYLIVGLHIDPSIERKQKNKPIESVFERYVKLKSCRYVDEIVVYQYESDLLYMKSLLSLDVRFLGSDYIDGTKPITEMDIPIVYIPSLNIHTADIRERIKKA